MHTPSSTKSGRVHWVLLCFLIAGPIIALVLVIRFRAEPPPSIPEIPMESLSIDSQTLVKRMRKQVLQNPESSTAWGKLEMAFFAHQFNEAADTCFTQAALKDPDEFRWPYLNGIQFTVSDPKRAQELFRVALKRGGGHSVVHCRFAELLFDQGEVEPAKQHFQNAIERDDRNARAWLGLARVAHHEDQLSASREYAEQAVELSSKEKAPRAFLARVLYQLGHKKEAERELRMAQNLPDDPFTWRDPYASEVLKMRRDTGWKLKEVDDLAAAGRLPEAIALLSHVVRNEKHDPAPAAKLGRLLTEAQHFLEAEKILQEAKEQFPHSSELEFRLGVLYFFTDRLPLAIRAFEAAIERNPTDFLAHYNLGQALLLQDKPDVALDALETAVKLRPASVPAQFALGKLLIDLKKFERAAQHLQAVLTLEPDHRKAQALLKQIL